MYLLRAGEKQKKERGREGRREGRKGGRERMK